MKLYIKNSFSLFYRVTSNIHIEMSMLIKRIYTSEHYILFLKLILNINSQWEEPCFHFASSISPLTSISPFCTSASLYTISKAICILCCILLFSQRHTHTFIVLFQRGESFLCLYTPHSSEFHKQFNFIIYIEWSCLLKKEMNFLLFMYLIVNSKKTKKVVYYYKIFCSNIKIIIIIVNNWWVKEKENSLKRITKGSFVPFDYYNRIRSIYLLRASSCLTVFSRAYNAEFNATRARENHKLLYLSAFEGQEAARCSTKSTLVYYIRFK